MAFNQQKIESSTKKILSLNVEEKLKMINIFCRHSLESGGYCNTFVASTNGVQIFFEGKPFPFQPHYLVFDCPKCHQTIKWRRKKVESDSIKQNYL